MPTSPPYGTYDPALDAQQNAARRGLFDLTQDTGTANLRDTVDYGLQRDTLLRGRDGGYGDLARNEQRGLADLGTVRTYGDQDYNRNLEMLRRSYSRLAGTQRQQMGAAGVVRGGAALQAAAKRAENQRLEREPMDTAYQRFLSANDQARSRLTEDVGLARTRLGEESDSALGRLALEGAPPDANNPFGGRRFQDRTTALTRAQREGQAFDLDLGAQRFYQAAAVWDPPAPARRPRPPRSYYPGARR